MTFDIPNYRMLEKIGTGAQTRIFRARCMRSGKDYAVKTVALAKPEDMQFVDMLKTEYEVGSGVRHPVLREVYELRMVRRRLRLRGALLFMEYVDGVTLSSREFHASLEEVLDIFSRCADGLHAMHQAGFVHADLKPSNILIRPDRSIKLIDFGQSCRAGQAKTKIQGTPDYIAPEQVRREPLDRRTDVFGLGAALHRVLTGQAVTTQMNQTLDMEAESVALKRTAADGAPAIDSLPAPVARLIFDACASSPADRMVDMAAFAHRARLAREILAKSKDALRDEDALLAYHDADDDDEGTVFDMDASEYGEFEHDISDFFENSDPGR